MLALRRGITRQPRMMTFRLTGQTGEAILTSEQAGRLGGRLAADEM